MADDKKQSPNAPITRDELLELMTKAHENTMLAVASMLQPKGLAQQSKEAVEAAQARLNTCQECRQKVAACKGKHRKAVVLPQNARDAQFFQGVILNGVKYLSNNLNHHITVPAFFNFEERVTAAAEQEDVNRNGRINQFNSGGIGKNQPGFKQAWSGFR